MLCYVLFFASTRFGLEYKRARTQPWLTFDAVLLLVSEVLLLLLLQPLLLLSACRILMLLLLLRAIKESSVCYSSTDSPLYSCSVVGCCCGVVAECAKEAACPVCGCA
jgi:hypothetical protein